MLTYADLFTPTLFLITNHTVGGEAVLANELMMRVLHTVLSAVQKQHRFRLLAYVFLPAQMRLLLEPAQGVVLDQIVGAVQQQFQADYQQILGIPGTLLLWERRYQVQRIMDVADLAQRLDGIHYAPVHYRLVDRPEQWPYSSYSEWAAQGLYPAEWGWLRPPHLVEKEWR